MTRFYTATITILLLLAGCRSSKNLLERNDQDKALFEAVKFLNKSATDENAIKALPILYGNAEKRHLDNIASYRRHTDISRFDKLLDEYDVLQRMYEAITASSTAGNYVRPISYHNEIQALKLDAADAYYNQGMDYFDLAGRANARAAYLDFKKIDKYVLNYKDAKAKMDEAYNNSIINVVINPVHDNSFFFNSNWGNSGYNYSNQYFQETLIRELGGTYASRYPARFYTDWQARRENVQPDWVVDLTLRNLYIPRPTASTYNRNVSKQVESGRDTAGHVIYQTVYATVNISRQNFTARGEMEVEIQDIGTHKRISYNTYSEDYRWEEEYATYTGDSRALDANDWTLVNARNSFNEPRKEDVLNELYRKLYPQIKNKISYEVDW